MKKYIVCVMLMFATMVFAQASSLADQQTGPASFRVSSTTFRNGGTLPLGMILGASECPYVSGGGDESPEVSWQNAPRGTRSFVVTLFDTTAAFTHWGMYNISPEASALPENAGVAGSTYGEQVFNDFYYGAQYDGPCPPNNYTPYVHDYVITVYALDTNLHLASAAPNFPANGETLYRAMFGHILQSASIQGYFSTASN